MARYKHHHFIPDVLFEVVYEIDKAKYRTSMWSSKDGQSFWNSAQRITLWDRATDTPPKSLWGKCNFHKDSVHILSVKVVENTKHFIAKAVAARLTTGKLISWPS